MKILAAAVAAAAVLAAALVAPSYGQSSRDDQDAFGQNNNQSQTTPWYRLRQMQMNRQMPSRATGESRFTFRRGNAVMDVRCSEREDLQNCVAAATKLLNQIAHMNAASSAPAPGSAQSPTSGSGQEDDGADHM